MLSQEHEAKIIALCERIGIPWARLPRSAEFVHAWYGYALNLTHSSLDRTSDLVHDVAHWLVAASERRADPYFGLTEFWDEDGYPGPSPEESISEEVHASLLGILIERALGMDWRYTWEFHSWDHEGWRGLRPVIRALRQRGLIRGLTPTCLPNSSPGDATSSPPSR